MRDESNGPDKTRRLLLLSGAALSGLAAVKLKETVMAAQEAEATGGGKPNLDSEHIKTFYRLNRF